MLSLIKPKKKKKKKQQSMHKRYPKSYKGLVLVIIISLLCWPDLITQCKYGMCFVCLIIVQNILVCRDSIKHDEKLCFVVAISSVFNLILQFKSHIRDCPISIPAGC